MSDPIPTAEDLRARLERLGRERRIVAGDHYAAANDRQTKLTRLDDELWAIKAALKRLEVQP